VLSCWNRLAVDDLSKSIGFYSALFAAEPTVLKAVQSVRSVDLLRSLGVRRMGANAGCTMAGRCRAARAAHDHLQATLALAEGQLRGADATGSPDQVRHDLEAFLAKWPPLGWMVGSGVIDDSDANRQPRHHAMFRPSSCLS
jgi:hypothetical protein